MNSKIANVIAVELGILIAILAWLAFLRLPSVRQPGMAAEQERTDGSFATVTRAIRGRNQHPNAVDYRADNQGGQQQDEEPTQTVRQYDQQIATSPYARSAPDDNVMTYSSPSYPGVDEEPVLYPPDQFDSPYNQIVEYPQPNEIIVFSNVRSFGRQLRPAARFWGARMMVSHRRPGRGESHARGGVLHSRSATNARPFRPSQGFRAR